MVEKNFFVAWNDRKGLFRQDLWGLRGVSEAIREADLEELEACEKLLERTIQVDGHFRYEAKIRSMIERRLAALVNEENTAEDTK